MSMSAMSDDNINTILSFLPHRDLIILWRVSKHFSSLIMKPELWASVNLGELGMSSMSQVLSRLPKTSVSDGKQSFLQFVNTLIISEKITQFSEEDFAELVTMCPNVKSFIMKASLSDARMRGYDTRKYIPTEILDHIQRWDLESVEFTGAQVAFNSQQDVFEPFFRSQPGLKHFVCDLDVSSSCGWAHAPMPTQEMEDIRTYGSKGVVPMALENCKDLETLVAPDCVNKLYMHQSFNDLPPIKVKSLAICIQPFRSQASAVAFASKLASVEVLDLRFNAFDWGDNYTHMAAFFSALTNVKELTVHYDGTFSVQHIDICSMTIKSLRIICGDTTRILVDGINISCPNLESLVVSSAIVDHLTIAITPRLSNIVFRSVILVNDTEAIREQYPAATIVSEDHV